MEIKFIEQFKTGSAQKALFEVDGQEVIVGMTSSFLSSLKNTPSHGDATIDFLKEAGILNIKLMAIKNKQQKEFIFHSHYLKPESGQIMTTQEEVLNYLKNKIREVEEESRAIGFKNN